MPNKPLIIARFSMGKGVYDALMQWFVWMTQKTLQSSNLSAGRPSITIEKPMTAICRVL